MSLAQLQPQLVCDIFGKNDLQFSSKLEVKSFILCSTMCNIIQMVCNWILYSVDQVKLEVILEVGMEFGNEVEACHY